MSISGRSPSSSAAMDRAARTRPSVGPVAVASGSRTGITDVGKRRWAADVGAEGGQLGGVRQVPDGDEVPHLFEAVAAGEVGGVVAAVVEEAGLAVDVTDRGVGDGDAVEAGGDVDQCAHDSHRRSRRACSSMLIRSTLIRCTRVDSVSRYVGRSRPPGCSGCRSRRSTPTSAVGWCRGRSPSTGARRCTRSTTSRCWPAETRRHESEPAPSLDVQIVTGVTTLDESGPCATAATTSPSWHGRARSSRSPSCCGPAHSRRPSSGRRRRAPMSPSPPPSLRRRRRQRHPSPGRHGERARRPPPGRRCPGGRTAAAGCRARRSSAPTRHRRWRGLPAGRVLAVASDGARHRARADARAARRPRAGDEHARRAHHRLDVDRPVPGVRRRAGHRAGRLARRRRQASPRVVRRVRGDRCLRGRQPAAAGTGAAARLRPQDLPG